MDRKEVSIREDENSIRVFLSGHAYVEVRRDTGEWMATQKTDSEEVFISLPSGAYVVESDGKINRIVTEHFEIKLP